VWLCNKGRKQYIISGLVYSSSTGFISRRGYMEQEKENKLEDQDTKVRKDLRNWGIWLIVVGVVSIIFSNFLNPIWGV
jgi:hypothetical protein